MVNPAATFNDLPNDVLGQIAKFSGETATPVLGLVSRRMLSIVASPVWNKVQVLKALNLQKKHFVKIVAVHTENWREDWKNIQFDTGLTKHVANLTLQLNDMVASSKFQHVAHLFARDAAIHLLFAQSQNELDELIKRHESLENSPGFIIVAKKNNENSNVSFDTSNLKPDEIFEFNEDASADEILNKIGLYINDLIQKKPADYQDEPELPVRWKINTPPKKTTEKKSNSCSIM